MTDDSAWQYDISHFQYIDEEIAELSKKIKETKALLNKYEGHKIVYDGFKEAGIKVFPLDDSFCFHPATHKVSTNFQE